MPFTQKVMFSVSFGVVLILNVLGNCTVFIIILKKQVMRTPMNYLLLHLALADLLVGLTAIPNNAIVPFFSHPQGMAGNLFCKIFASDNLTYICGQVSALILIVIASERYKAVVIPHKVKKKVTNAKIFACVFLCWIVSIGIFVPWLYWAKLNTKTGQCDLGKPPLFAIHIYRYVNILVFVVPMLSMAVYYGLVVRQLVKSENRNVDRKLHARKKTRTRITWMLVTVAIVYVICWCPVTVFFTTTNEGNEHILYKIFTLLVVFNSSVNAFIYTLFSKKFRKGVRNIFRFSSKRPNNTVRY